MSAVTAAMLLPVAGASAAPTDGPTGSELAGKTVFLDPGHQGSAAGHALNKQVPNGYGGMKDCATTGMETVTGVAEHEINWNVASIVKGVLESLGAKVEMSRADDTGWGGCIDERAAAANKSGADVAVSIHADSTVKGADEQRNGFHMIIPKLPLPNAAAQAAQAGGGLTASKLMVDSYKEQGFKPANYAGVQDGLMVRDDIAGPALTTVPLVFIEMGNGSNPGDAAKLGTTEGQYEHATAIARGIVSYLFSDGYPATLPAGATPSTPAVTAPGATTTGAASDPKVTITMDDGTVSTPVISTPAISGAAAAVTNPLTAKTPAEQAGIFDRIDEVLALFQKIVAADGIDALLALINEGELDTISDLTTDVVALLGPLVSQVLAE